MSCWSYIILLFLLHLGFGGDSDIFYYNFKMLLIFRFFWKVFLEQFRNRNMFVLGAARGAGSSLQRALWQMDGEQCSPGAPADAWKWQPWNPSAHTQADCYMQPRKWAWSWNRPRGPWPCGASSPPPSANFPLGPGNRCWDSSALEGALASAWIFLVHFLSYLVLSLAKNNVLPIEESNIYLFTSVLFITYYIEACSQHAQPNMGRLMQGFHK